jgi:hypothetical protein
LKIAPPCGLQAALLHFARKAEENESFYKREKLSPDGYLAEAPVFTSFKYGYCQKPLLHDFVVAPQIIGFYHCCEPVFLHAKDFSGCTHNKV